MANEKMQLSDRGYADLRLSEGVRMAFYNDSASHCTFGVGTLVHFGPCTADEMQQTVTGEMVNTSLATGVHAAEAAVRAGVSAIQLKQAQFDALVSFVYNVGATGARAALAAANQGAMRNVAAHMQAKVYVRPRDAQGRRAAPQRLQGLVNRRQRESAPFLD
jgi:lysozyme